MKHTRVPTPKPVAEVIKVDLAVTTHGEVDDGDEAYAMEKISFLLQRFSTDVVPVLFAEVELRQEPDPARERRSIAEAVLDVNGQPVRAHVAAPSMPEAIDLLEDRLRRRLERHDHARDDRRSRLRRRGEHTWRHGESPAQRPEYFDRLADERQLVRRKSFAPAEMTPDEAADALDLLGHDFFLFTNLLTGADAVVSYADDHTLDFIDASGREDALGTATVTPMRFGRLAPRRCTVAEATEQLDLDLELTRFVFFVDTQSSRGSVVYHRYDGHYGLVTLT